LKADNGRAGTLERLTFSTVNVLGGPPAAVVDFCHISNTWMPRGAVTLSFWILTDGELWEGFQDAK